MRGKHDRDEPGPARPHLRFGGAALCRADSAERHWLAGAIHEHDGLVGAVTRSRLMMASIKLLPDAGKETLHVMASGPK